MAEQALARNPGEGRAYWVLGGLYEVKAASEETGGLMTVMEITLPAGMGPPPHTHPGTETIYVLEGRVRFHVEGEKIDGGPGSFFHAPERTWENFEPLTDARLLVIYTPGGMERFFAEIGEPAPVREVPPGDHPLPALRWVTSIGHRYGLEMRLPD